MLAAFRLPAFTCQQRRLSGHGQPLTDASAAAPGRYVDGLTTKDSAGRIGKSDVAVRVMLSRTVQKLQQRLGK
jgi:hypothetical protein